MLAFRRVARVLGSRSIVGKSFIPASCSPKFATTRAMSTSLANSLKAEIKYEEKSENRELSEDYLEMKTAVTKAWKTETSSGSAVVTMTKQHKNETITVKFNVHDIAEDYFVEDYQEEEDEDANPEDMGSSGLNFQVIIDKQEAGKIVVDAVGGEKGLSIRNVRYATAGEDLEKDGGYTGPVFDDLEEELQEEFFKYLDERKVNDELAGFVLSFAEEKEDEEYLAWLKNLHSFVAK